MLENEEYVSIKNELRWKFFLVLTASDLFHVLQFSA